MMKKPLSHIFCIVSFYIIINILPECVTASNSAKKAKIKVKKQDIRLSNFSTPFIKNIGQLRKKKIKYYAVTNTSDIFITNDSILYLLPETKSKKKNIAFYLKERFLHNKSFKAEGINPSKSKINFFKTNDSNRWTKNPESFNT